MAVWHTALKISQSNWEAKAMVSAAGETDRQTG